MKPQWDKLIAEFKDKTHALIADVDCTAEGKDLCTRYAIQGYPSIKYGRPGSFLGLQDYRGGRDFDSLKKFADENLGPFCGPANVELCDEATQKQLKAMLPMDTQGLVAALAEAEQEIKTELEHWKQEWTIKIDKGRKPDGTPANPSIGFALEKYDNERVFRITAVRDGLGKEFNAANPNKEVKKGDFIVKVNGAEGCEDMHVMLVLPSTDLTSQIHELTIKREPTADIQKQLSKAAQKRLTLIKSVQLHKDSQNQNAKQEL